MALNRAEVRAGLVGLISAVAVLAAPLSVAAQSDKGARVGVLRPAPDDPVFRQMFEPFKQTLRERGFEEGMVRPAASLQGSCEAPSPEKSPSSDRRDSS